MKNITTYSIKYNLIQDRIQLTGNAKQVNQRVDFWVTRKMTSNLISLSSQLLKDTSPFSKRVPQESKQALHSLERDSAIKSTTLEKKSIPPTPEEPTLMTKVDIKVHDKHLKLTFYNEDNVAIAISQLNRSEMHIIISMMSDYAKKADWGLDDAILEWPQRDARPERTH
jgi:hypothetical protein